MEKEEEEDEQEKKKKNKFGPYRVDYEYQYE